MSLTNSTSEFLRRPPPRGDGTSVLSTRFTKNVKEKCSTNFGPDGMILILIDKCDISIGHRSGGACWAHDSRFMTTVRIWCSGPCSAVDTGVSAPVADAGSSTYSGCPKLYVMLTVWVLPLSAVKVS